MNAEQLDRFNIYMALKGNRQYAQSPFGDLNWLPYVSSYYGYRVHPISGDKNYHTGTDIALPTGTEILAGGDGVILQSGTNGGYGLCVLIDYGGGITARYGHCSSLLVSTGQAVQAGDVIARVGSTGNSTGPHLHLEIMKNGRYLNPLYFAVTNDYGGGPSYTGDPGAAMGGGTYAAMLAEAEKYLGYPYVWGGSSPSTSFDCSGFVCWVINHSGAGNVGRTTAQGLYNLCTPVSPGEARPGDLIFFTKTYSTADTVTHVGIYTGNNTMINAGDPIKYERIDTPNRASHFYAFGRLPG
jgi:cell wall-associated NlpC family hydrolase